jgi:hypothetical protein
MIRGIEGKRIFRDTQDWKDFVTPLGDLAKQTDTRILAWSLLGRERSRTALNVVSGVWYFGGGDSEAVRVLHLGHRQGNSKKGWGGLKGSIFHYVS